MPGMAGIQDAWRTVTCDAHRRLETMDLDGKLYSARVAQGPGEHSCADSARARSGLLARGLFGILRESMNPQTSARVAFWTAICFGSILATLHFLEPEFNDSGHLISEYELGRYGWLMSLAFFSLGAASIFLFHSIRNDLRGAAGSMGGWWLLLIGVAYFVAGIFYPDQSTGGLGLPINPADFKRGAVAPTLNATFHGAAGVTVIGSSPISPG